jgi:hypothetical protein
LCSFFEAAANELERAMTQKYYSAAKEPKELWEVLDAGHTGAFQSRPEDYEKYVVGVFDQALRDQETNLRKP